MKPYLLLTLAFGLSTGVTAESGLQPVVGNIVGESLIAYTKEGRPQPRLAEGLTVAPDGLSIRIHLRQGVTFHDPGDPH